LRRLEAINPLSNPAEPASPATRLSNASIRAINDGALAEPEEPGSPTNAGVARVGAKELVALAQRAAEAHELWPELVCAIVEQESAWDPWALRYEPAFYESYIAPQIARGEIAGVTESRARAFSWGLMQVMGQVAREHGFTGALASLCDPAVGLEIGCRVFAAKLAAAEGNVTRALLLWNGAGNRDYPAAVLARTARYV
jgi:soluble lytic murein transglycosylase-like protein